MESHAEAMLRTGLLEAISDLEFIGRESTDGFVRFLANEAAVVAGLYLEEAEKGEK